MKYNAAELFNMDVFVVGTIVGAIKLLKE